MADYERLLPDDYDGRDSTEQECQEAERKEAEDSVVKQRLKQRLQDTKKQLADLKEEEEILEGILDGYRMKEQTQRELKLKELLETEKVFQADMNLCFRTFYDPTETEDKAPSFMDMEFLFGNLQYVIEVSKRLLTKLQPSGSDSSLLPSGRDTGLAFKALADDMEKAYRPYCADLDKLLEKMKEYREEPAVGEYLARKIKEMDRTDNIPDAETALKKPFERIQKYHLFLRDLIKLTEDEDDKQHLGDAQFAMHNVCTKLNKRVGENQIVRASKKFERKASLFQKCAMLTMNLGRSPEIAAQEYGDFDERLAHYRSTGKTLEVFLSNVGRYVEGLMKVKFHQGQLAEHIALYYEGRLSEEARRYYIVSRNLSSRYTKMTESVESYVKVPLQTVQAALEKPNTLISERHSKYLDYQRHSRQTRAAMDDPSKESYEALNRVLLRELPYLRRFIKDALKHCLAALVRVQREFTEGCLEDSNSLHELVLPALLGTITNGTLAVENFNVRPANQTLDQIARLQFTPTKWSDSFYEEHPCDPTSLVQTASTAQPREMVIAARDQAGSILDTADQRYGATRSCDQSHAKKTAAQSRDRAAVLQAAGGPPHPDVSTAEMYKAEYPFQARNSQELTLAPGNVVIVLRHSDSVGNPEWWLVSNCSADRQTGYVPVNYLRKI